jgi:hypothetical protein
MASVPKGEKALWHEKAMKTATKGRLGEFMGLCVKTKEWDRLAARIHAATHVELEVDLLCAAAGVVIELDGAQHFADAAAYRRDRRKDVLLQQNGCFVLRFLTEDAGKRLDQVLDTILASLIHRENRPRGK